MESDYHKYIYKKIVIYALLITITIILGLFITLLKPNNEHNYYKNFIYNNKYNYPYFNNSKYDNEINNYIKSIENNYNEINYNINKTKEYLNIIFEKKDKKNITHDSIIFDKDNNKTDLITYLNIDEYSYYYHINEELNNQGITLKDDIASYNISTSILNESIILYIEKDNEIYSVNIPISLMKEKIEKVIDPKNYKYVAFTFDDGPSKYTLEIMDILDEYNFKATFFEVGYMMKSNPEIVKEVVSRGYEIGNHTTDHSNLNKLSKENIAKKINNNSELLKEYTGLEMDIVRCPYGNSNKKVREVIDKPIIYWSIDSRDWESRNPSKIYNLVTSQIEDGDIILFHDIYSTTKDAVKDLAPYLYSQGYKIVTVSKLYEIKEKKLENHVVHYNAK